MTDSSGQVGRARRWRPPVATLALAALLVCGFVVQLVGHDGPREGLFGTNAVAARAFGALDPELVQGGQWWRIATSALLHADALHLVLNEIALVLGGLLLEPLLGPLWIAALFWCGVAGGGVASTFAGAADTVTVGASGGILAVLAGGLVATLRLPRGVQRTRVRVLAAQMAVPALIPGLFSSGEHVDFAAHAGGAAAGVVVAATLLLAWPRARPRVPLGGVAAAIVLASLGATAVGVREVARTWRTELEAAALYDQLLDDADARALVGRSRAELEQVASSWPEDPRVAYLLAQAYLGERRYLDAVEVAGGALALLEGIDLAFEDGRLEASVRVVRAIAAIEGGVPNVAPLDIAELCGRLAATDGGNWAARNQLCTPTPEASGD